MAAAFITKTTDGLVFRDQFTRANSDTVGNSWREDARASQATTMRIQSNNLDSNGAGVNQVYMEGASGDTNPLGAGSKMYQVNIDYAHGAGTGRIQLGLRSSELPDTTGSQNAYFCFWDSSSDESECNVYTAGSRVQQNFTATDGPGANIKALRFVLEDNLPTNVKIRMYGTGVLSSITDLTKTFTGLGTGNTGNPITDTTAKHAYGGDETDFTILSTFDVLVDEAIIMGRNLVMSGLPTGWKVSGDQGTTKTAESGSGTATQDVDTFAFPSADIRVYDDSDVLQATLTEDVWGGGVYEFTGATPELPTTLRGTGLSIGAL